MARITPVDYKTLLKKFKIQYSENSKGF